MQLRKSELHALAKRTEGRTFRTQHAALAGGLLGFAALLEMTLLIAEYRDIEDAIFYLGIPSVVGGLIGSCAGVVVLLAIARRKISPTFGAILSSAGSAFGMLLL